MFTMHLNNPQKNQEMQISDNEIIDGAAEWGSAGVFTQKRSREDLEREIQELEMQLQPKKNHAGYRPCPYFIADTINNSIFAKNNKTQGQKADKTIRSAAIE